MLLRAAAARLAPAERVALLNGNERVALLNGNGSHPADGHRSRHPASAERVSSSIAEMKDVRRYNGNGIYPSDPGACEDLGQLGQDEYRAVEPSSGSNVIPRRARPGLAGLGPHQAGRLLCPEAGPSRYPEEGPQCIEV